MTGQDKAASPVPSDYRPLDWRGKPVDIPLVDDLATVLAGVVVGWTDVIGVDLAQAPEVVRVMARYRSARENTDSLA